MENGDSLRVYYAIARNFVRRKIDRFVLYPLSRWASLFVLLFLFFTRVFLLQGFFAVAYLLGFYYLQNLILFMTPNTIPTIQEEENEGEIYDIPEGGPSVERSEDSSKPVIRKLGEFTLWKKLVLGTFVATLATFFETLDFPVFWPLLLGYFLFIVASVSLKQYHHMKKYGYSFGDFFKKAPGRG